MIVGCIAIILARTVIEDISAPYILPSKILTVFLLVYKSYNVLTDEKTNKGYKGITDEQKADRTVRNEKFKSISDAGATIASHEGLFPNTSIFLLYYELHSTN
jgi:hypothetical protein